MFALKELTKQAESSHAPNTEENQGRQDAYQKTSTQSKSDLLKTLNSQISNYLLK